MDVVNTLTRLGFEVDVAQADVVVVGGGGAASRAAVSAAVAGAKVMVLAKAPIGTGGSTVHGASEIMSMGASGYGSVEDSTDIHYHDTMRAAAGFIDPALVRVLAEDAPARIRDLIELGVPFDQVVENQYKLIQSDFGSFPRALGVLGKTGKAFVNALAKKMQSLDVVVRAPVALIDLLRNSTGDACGVLGVDLETGRLQLVHARATVLGTGGAHGLFSQQVSTAEMIGDGQAICYRHGAELVNMEFHQFGPALIHPYVQLFSKSCFVLHPKITNALGHEFLNGYLPNGVAREDVMDEKVFPFTISNASRYIDISIASEIAQGRGTDRSAVYFSFEHVSPQKLSATIPNTMRWMAAKGIDPRRDLLEVGIAFQCLNGGVRMTDADASSTLAGLFVIGELAGGVRGPDRPGGNSLAEGQVFGHRAGVGAARYAAACGAMGGADAQLLAQRLEHALRPNVELQTSELANTLRTAMQRHCLVEKNAVGLAEALDTVRGIRAQLMRGGGAEAATVMKALSLDNMATTAELILAACLRRQESRSSHYRTDFPACDAGSSHAVVIAHESGAPRFSTLAYPHHDESARLVQ